MRRVLATLMLLALPVTARADIHHTETWFDLDNCTRGAWVSFYLPAGTYTATWKWSDGQTSSVQFVNNSPTYESMTVNNGYTGWPVIVKHTISWAYIGDPPDDTPIYYGGGCS